MMRREEDGFGVHKVLTTSIPYSEPSDTLYVELNSINGVYAYPSLYL